MVFGFYFFLDVGIGRLHQLFDFTAEITAHFRRAYGTQRAQCQTSDVLIGMIEITRDDETIELFVREMRNLTFSVNW